MAHTTIEGGKLFLVERHDEFECNVEFMKYKF